MESKGVVKFIDANKIIISAYKKESCNKCKVCTEGGKFEKEYEFKIKQHTNAKIGDPVIFEVEDRKILQYSFLIYIFPLLGFFLGYYLVHRFINESSEAVRILGSFGGMIFCYMIVHLLDKRLSKILLKKIEVYKI